MFCFLPCFMCFLFSCKLTKVLVGIPIPELCNPRFLLVSAAGRTWELPSLMRVSNECVDDLWYEQTSVQPVLGITSYEKIFVQNHVFPARLGRQPCFELGIRIPFLADGHVGILLQVKATVHIAPSCGGWVNIVATIVAWYIKYFLDI